MQFDKWQNKFLDEAGHKILVSGRQTGKSTITARDAAEFAINNKETTTLIISRTERQAQELLNKTLNFIHEIEIEKEENYIAKGKDKPTMSRIRLKNKSEILSLPTGMAGEGIRGFTIHRLIADEAQLITQEVFAAVTPMLLTTGGKMILLGTPQGKTGYFYDCYLNKFKQFTVFHVNTVEAINNRELSEDWPHWKRDAALNHIAQERERMSAKEFAQEYEGQFVEDLNSFFSDELIKKCCILKTPKSPRKDNNYMGVDIARMGRDASVFSIVHVYENSIHQYANIIRKRQYTTETEDNIRQLDITWQPEKIGIDAGSGSLGVGIWDRLMLDDYLKRKIVAMNNRSVSLDRYGKSKQKIFKEEMYENILAMMEKGEILLLDDDELVASLKSIQYEYIDDSRISRMRIFSANNDCTEALIRAAWLAKKEKLYKLQISYI